MVRLSIAERKKRRKKGRATPKVGKQNAKRLGGRAVGGAKENRSRKTPLSAFVSGGKVKGRVGAAVIVVVAETTGDKSDVASVSDDRTVVARRTGDVETRISKAMRAMATPSRVKRLSGTIAALAHPARVVIMVKLLQGPATYQALKKVSGLKVGPLYHHINQLRLASLILPKQRDLYALTRGGRNVLLGSLALMSLASDGRGRPEPMG